MASKIQITREMKRQFQSETTEHLNNLEKQLMSIEQAPDRAEVVDAAFRCVHSVKGNSDYLGVRDINELAHIVEDIMDEVRSGRMAATQPVVDVLFQCLDLLKDMNRRVADPDYQETDLTAIRAAAANLTPLPSLPGNGGDRTVGEGAGGSGLDVSDVLERDIKVDINKIDRFMEHISEFAEAHNTLQHLANAVSSSSGPVAEQFGGDIRAVTTTMKKVFDNFQTDIMAMRLMSLTTLFDRLARMTRDLSRRQGKRVALKVSGGDVAVDRKILSGLVDPLVHLIRNAVDHGIETPEERAKAGKPETGVVSVNARKEGVLMVIEVADDGRGLSRERIRQAALEGGFTDADSLAAMTDAETARLVFKPGFTTRQNADAISGRGVGLDVVESAVTAIGGRVSLSTDQGVRVNLRVPISMAVTQVLLIRAGNGTYAVPFGGVCRIIRAQRDRIRRFKKAKIMVWKGELMTVLGLKEWLEPYRPSSFSSQEAHILVVSVGGQTLGIEVDEVLRRESVVIRPLRRFLTGFRSFSGAAVLGDGRVVMVIDPVEMAGEVKWKRQKESLGNENHSYCG